MPWTEKFRTAQQAEVGVNDQRNKYQQDRDRILYSSAFSRLSGVTQIVLAGEEDVFHTRLTHSIKVAQVGRRISESVVFLQKDNCEALGSTLKL